MAIFARIPDRADDLTKHARLLNPEKEFYTTRFGSTTGVQVGPELITIAFISNSLYSEIQVNSRTLH
jgi:hypothetical protein